LQVTLTNEGNTSQNPNNRLLSNKQTAIYDMRVYIVVMIHTAVAFVWTLCSLAGSTNALEEHMTLYNKYAHRKLL
jgi:hypothetical protein